MALETLRDITSIGGFEVGRCDEGTDRNDNYVHIVDSINAIAFKIQNGPVNENGINGCQVDALIETAKIIIEGLNKTFPCRENSMAITKLDEALRWLEKRTADRKKREVEGFSRA